MNDADPNGPSDQDKFECLLEDFGVAQPSPRLDRRIDALLHPGWRRFITPIASFAAGIVVASIIPAMLSHASSTPLALNAPNKPIIPPIAAPVAPREPALVFVAEPHQSTEELTGTIDGIPVRIQRTRTQVTLWPSQSSNGPRGEFRFPDTVTVALANQY